MAGKGKCSLMISFRRRRQGGGEENVQFANSVGEELELTGGGTTTRNLYLN